MQNASLRIGFLLLAASLTLLGCENSASHRGGSKARKAKAQPTPEPVKQDAPVQAAEEEPVVVQQQPEPVVQPEPVRPLPAIQQPQPQPEVQQQPVITQQPAVVPQALPQAPAQGEGNLYVPVTALSNMASGNQISNDDNYAVLKNSQGQVIASGPMSVHAVLNGHLTDSRNSSLKTLVLNISLTKVEASESGGAGQQSGHLRIGRYKNGSFVDVPNLHGKDDGYYLPNDYNYNVQYTRSGNEFKVLRVQGGNLSLAGGGSAGSGYNLKEGSAEAPLVATVHPTDADKASETRNDFQSPLVLDLNKNGKLDLIDAFSDDQKIYFDLDGKGKKYRTGWVKAQDGMLALDLNHNGKIDSGRELFGENTGLSSKKFDNGFHALAVLDSNRDGKLTKSDKLFNKLLIWQDKNQDGISQKAELKSISFHKISEISLAYTMKTPHESDRVVAGNEVRETSSFKTTAGKSQIISDVWFKQRRLSDRSFAAKAHISNKGAR